MKFLFFDIECANCFNGVPKICEFGYVLTDERFNVLKKHDIPMSPGRGRGTSFDMKIRKFDPDFDWAYDVSYYYSCPEFPKYYDLIANLLKDEDTLIFGFSVFNDVTYLDSAISLYGLERFDYQVNDIQMLASSLLKKKSYLSLEKLFSCLCGKEELIHLQPHLSRDDAYMSMGVLRALCLNEHLSPKELFQKFPRCSFSSSEALDKHRERLRRQKEGAARLKEGKKRWNEFCAKYPNGPHPWVFPNASLLKDLEKLDSLMDFCVKTGCGPCSAFYKSDVFLTLLQNEKEKASRSSKGNYIGQVLTFKEFKDASKPHEPS